MEKTTCAKEGERPCAGDCERFGLSSNSSWEKGLFSLKVTSLDLDNKNEPFFLANIVK